MPGATMPAASDYVTGTISLTNGSINFTGTSTGWLLAGFKEGDTIIDITGATEYMGVIATIDANGAGTLTKAWEGPTLSNVAYRMRYQPDGARVSAQARNLIELLGNGNVLALAGLSGSANQVPMFTGPGAMTLVPKTDLVSGADYDVQVADLAARAAYDAQAEGYSVLVADTGDGRAAIYSKVSATSGDWSDPAYVTGPVGPLPDVTVGTVTTGDPGSAAQVTATPTVDGVELDFTIPAGEGFAFQGAYSGATTYVLGDVAQDSGSSWILTVAESTGNAPPTLPTTSNAYWQLLARQGIDGAGTVNSVVAGTNIVVDSTDPTAPVVSATGLVKKSGDTMTGPLGLGGSLTIGSEGPYAAGSLYSDANWGMIIRALTASPAVGMLSLRDASDGRLMQFSNTGQRETPIIGFAGLYEAFDCRAWANYDATTGIIRASKGISSIVYLSTGRFTVNLSVAMPDAYYSAFSTNNLAEGGVYGPAASSFNVWCGKGGAELNPSDVFIAIFR